jgi:lysine biosynthesis protein LysW
MGRILGILVAIPARRIWRAGDPTEGGTNPLGARSPTMNTAVLTEKVTACLECDRKIKLARNAALDDMVTCGHCGTSFVIIDLSPIEIDFADDDWEDEDWGDDDDDWEDDGDDD